MNSDARIARLEEVVAFLERHVTEQDKAILELSDEVARQRKAITALRDRLAQAAPSEPAPPANDLPPHYGRGL